MPVIRFPTPLRYYVENQSEVVSSAVTVDDLLKDLVSRYPSLKVHLVDQDGKLRRHFHIFVNGEHVRELNGMETILKTEDQLILLASAAGG